MYIYQRHGWPAFTWDKARLEPLLADVQYVSARLIGKLEGLGFDVPAPAVFGRLAGQMKLANDRPVLDHRSVLLEALTEDGVRSSEIEGDLLDREAVRSSVARRLNLPDVVLKPESRAIAGLTSMLVDATTNYMQALSKQRLFNWQQGLFPGGRSDLDRVTTGGWRHDNNGPMQVISGPIGFPQVHFEAPAAHIIENEMDAFLTWFNAEESVDPLLKAGIAHFWFVTIHPFEDGNGRIARTIADMALSRAESSGQRFYSMSAQILKERKGYYAILERSQKGNLDITPWLEWFLTCLGSAIIDTDGLMNSTLSSSRFWQLHAHITFNERQRIVIKRLLAGFEGKMTSTKWAAIAKCSQDSAQRDLDALINAGIMEKGEGGGRNTSYQLIMTVK